MGKLLFWVVVIGAVWIAIKFAQASARRVARDRERSREHGDGRGGSKRGGGDADARDGEPMVQCAHCGVYLPRSDAVSGGALHYCSAAHRDAGPKGP